MKIERFARMLATAALSAALVSGCARTGLPVGRAQPTPAPNASVAPSTAQANDGLPDFVDVVRRYGPAVVNISVQGTTKVAAMAAPPGGWDPLWRLFGRLASPTEPRELLVRGEGSGFIVSPDGVILTNAHVVDGMKSVTVTLADKRRFNARVVGSDKRSDVAVLEIDAHHLPTVRLGDSSHVRVGEWVAAMGSPYGFENSVTSGIVSAKARALPGAPYVPYLQTDAAVNPGNSGGPLFELDGDVIGLNSMIYTGTGGFEGLSFAVPIDVALHAERQLLAHGHVTYGRLGAMVQTVNQPLADAFGLPVPRGALITSLDPRGPAARAALKPADVVLQVDGNDVDRASALTAMVGELAPGSHATFEIWRNGGVHEVGVTIGNLDHAVVASR